MLGSGLKKLAKENGMAFSRGIAYGSLGGYGATLCQGFGYTQISFSTRLADPAKKDWLLAQVHQVDVLRVYQVQSLEIRPRYIRLRFSDGPGTVKGIRVFLDRFLPLMGEAGASKADICGQCGCQVTAGCRVLADGVVHRLHDGCVRKLQEESSQQAREGTGVIRSPARGVRALLRKTGRNPSGTKFTYLK